MSKLEEPPLTEPHIMSLVFPTKFIRNTQSRTFKQTAVVKDLYSWIGTFHSVPAHFSIALDKGRILKDLSQQLCQIGNHIVIEVLQIHPDVIRGNEDIISTELICKCAICTDGLLPDEMVARPNQCFHIFHHTCIDEWLKVDEEGGMACPVCGKKFKSIIVCSTTDEPEKKMCVSESVENREGEAQKLVFEDYMDNGQDSGKLKEARAKEWESLSENTITRAFVNRDTIVEDILQLYRVNETIASTPLEVTFLNEPAEDADGLTRELFSQGWKSILPLFFEGTNFHVSRVDPDCTEELFEILGRLASHGFVLTGYFPVEIAPASVIGIFDPDALNDKDLIYSFLSCLTEGERAAAEKAMEKSKVSVDDILVDILSRYNVRQIPTSRSEFQSLFVRIAKCEFVTKPSVLMAAFKSGLEKAHPAIWKEMNASDIRALYVRLYPTAEKLVELLEPSEEYMPLNSRRDRVFEFLRRYVRSLSKEKVPSPAFRL